VKLSELQDALKVPAGGGVLSVDGNTLSGSIGSLFADFLPNGRFEARVKEPEPGKFKDGDQEFDAVKVDGTLLGEFLGVPGLKVQAWFFLTSDDKAEVTIALSEMPDLSRSFPSLPEAAAFSKCAFALDSRRPHPLGRDFDRLFSPARDPKRGLTFQATLNVPAIDGTLADFGIPQDPLAVTGPVELDRGLPRMRLTTTKGTSLPKLIENIDLNVEYQYLTAIVNGNQKTKERLRYKLLCGTGPDAVAVPLAITFDPDMLSEIIVVESDWEATKSPLSLKRLISLLPKVNEGLNALIPQKTETIPDIQSKFDLRLAALMLELRTNPLSLSGLNARLELGLDWPIVKGKNNKDLVNLRGLALDLSIKHFEDAWEVSPYLSATMTLAGGTLSGGVDLSTGRFCCVLDDDKDASRPNQVDLKQLITETLGLPQETFPFEKFALTRFEIWGDISGASYGIDIATTFSWTLPEKLGKIPITIKDLFLTLEYDGSSLTPALGGSLELFQMTFGCVARYGPPDGWKFQVTALNIPLTDLLVSILGEQDKAKAEELPKVTFPALELEVTPTTGAFRFRGEADLDWKKPFGADASFRCKVELRLDRQPAKNPACNIKITGEGSFKVDQRELSSKINVVATNDQGPLKLQTWVSIEGLEFGLSFVPESKTFLATYHDVNGRAIKIDDLLSQIFVAAPTTGIELTLKDALFAYRGDEQEPKYLFGLNIGIKVGLAKLPVVGPALPAGLEFSVEDLQILAATRAFTLTQVNALNDMMPGTATKLPSQKPDGGDTALRQGLNVSAKLKLAGADKLLMLPASEATTPTGGGPAPAAAPTPAPTAVDKSKAPAGISKWFEIDKSLGPLSVRRIGLAYEAPKVGIKFDASLQLSFLTFNLEGLGLRYPLGGSTEPAEVFKKLEPTLDGMGLALGNGPIEIGGSLVRVPADKLELEGALLIRTAPFTFSALGSYVDLNGTISVMAFAVLLRELGDPTGTGAFVVTGLAFGFGVNRKLTIPPVEEVHNFPLIQAAMGKQDFKSLAVLPGKLRPYVSPAVGNFWIAGGIKFNSFAMVDSFLLLSVSWGAEVEIALLGLSRMTVPPLVEQDKAVAGVELALRGVIRIADGLIQFEARLTENSFIFSKACRLYGGFAFCVWFAGPHAGDFVVSLGGYHPAFARPAHYPLVRRLGMQLQIGTELCITGEAYFALTPSCIMAGGKLCGVFKSGGIEAWFIAYVDFLMNWQPFYYQAAMGITLGVALRLAGIAMRLEVSVDLRLQGPPFGGEARVVLWVISFTIPFGERASAPPPLKPREFVNNCLPAPKDPKKDKSPDVFSVRITGGLLREQEIKGQNRTHRIVNAHRLSLIAQSVIPCTEFGGLAKGLGAKASCGIRPMGKTNLKSVFSVTADGIIPGRHVEVSAITGNVADAVWGKSETEGLVPLLKTPERKTIEAALGIRMVSIPQDPVQACPL